MARTLSIVAVLLGAAGFAAVSLADDRSGSAVTSKDSNPAMRYVFSDVKVSAGDTGGRAIKCPKKWHPVSGLFTSDSSKVVSTSSAPVSERKWSVSVRNEGTEQASVTIGAVCVTGIPIAGSG